jgi:hypothetical protein
MNPIQFFCIGLGILLLSGCTPSPSIPSSETSLPIPSATKTQAVPTMVLATNTSEALIPAGWVTHTSQQCEYAISYPSEMVAHAQNPYSETILFNLPDPEEGARNFLYVSVIDPEIQNRAKQGAYLNEVYNFDPVEMNILLDMQVGESKPVHEFPNVESGFTFQRQMDAVIGDQTALTYERVQPWEFPIGTKEIRYYLSLNGCIYMIGGYMDMTGSNQLGAITEDLFHQIVATIRLMP